MPTQLYDRYGNPLVTAPSVLDAFHPDNNRPHTDDGREYTFRQRAILPLKFSLGWELEANHTPDDIPSGIENIEDGSVDGEGAEFVVLPAITKSPRYVLSLLKDLVHAPKLNTDKSCGFHVHVSTSNLSLPRMRLWAMATERLAIQIEDLAFNAVPESRKGNTYCRRINPLHNGTRFVSNKYSNDRRYYWFNTVEMFRPNGIRTMENRLLGHTHRWKYLLAWTYFTMELARRGWELANRPFDMEEHINPLETLLKRIATEIKPLELKNEPVPQWVYNGLMQFGIDQKVWDRPLMSLAHKECELKGIAKPLYSDNQIEIPNREEDNSDYCPCDCGNEGRCDFQMHEDGDCESNYCERCHDNGDCSGSPDCERCVRNAHADGENCGSVSCRRCRPAVASRPIAVRPPVRAIDPATPVTASESNVTFSSVTTNHVGSTPLTDASIRQAVNHLRTQEENAMQSELDQMRNIIIDGATLQTTGYRVIGSEFYGRSVTEILNSPAVSPTISEERNANDMLDTHEIALSANREHELNNQHSRTMMTPLERDASMERLEMVRGCPVGCDDTHDMYSECLICNMTWGQHTGHRCRNGGIGSFLVERGGR